MCPITASQVSSGPEETTSLANQATSSLVWKMDIWCNILSVGTTCTELYCMYMSIPTHCVRLSIMNINVPPRTILCPTYLLSSPCNKLGGSTSSLLSSAPSIELHPTPVTCSDGLFYGSNQLVEIININRSLLWLKRGYS